MSIIRDDGTTEHPARPLLTAELLRRVFPYSPEQHRVDDAAALSSACARAGIDTPELLAALLGQIGHESGELRYPREIWGPSALQSLYERDMHAPWAPRGRNAKAWVLNNNQPGDGYTFRAWGWLGVTGRGNTLSASLRVYGDDRLIWHPELLDDRELAAIGAVDYWVSHDLSAVATAGDYRRVSSIVNCAPGRIATDGPPSHHLIRLAYRDRALAVLTETV